MGCLSNILSNHTLSLKIKASAYCVATPKDTRDMIASKNTNFISSQN